MEIIRKHIKLKKRKLKNQIKFWEKMGKIGPAFLLILILFLLFTQENSQDWLLLSVAGMLSVVAVIWWWWVINSVNNIYDTMQRSMKKFEKIILEIKQIRTQYKQNKDQ